MWISMTLETNLMQLSTVCQGYPFTKSHSLLKITGVQQ